MPTTDSPAAARRRLRFALRTAREAAELTQAEVADRLEWSVSKVNRIENGEVTISATDLRALMTLVGVTDQDTVEQLTAWARAAAACTAATSSSRPGAAALATRCPTSASKATTRSSRSTRARA